MNDKTRWGVNPEPDPFRPFMHPLLWTNAPGLPAAPTATTLRTDYESVDPNAVGLGGYYIKAYDDTEGG